MADAALHAHLHRISLERAEADGLLGTASEPAGPVSQHLGLKRLT
jgi:hypothetical protein